MIGWAQVSGWVRPTESGWVQVSGIEPVWVAYNGSCIDTRIYHCGSVELQIPDDHRGCLDARFAGLQKVVLSEPPAPYGNGDDCVSNSGRLATVVIVLLFFSLCVQMSEGLTYGVVPYVSRPALGVVSGMVGAGGNAGSLITNALFFSASIRSDLGFVYMGIAILGVTSLLIFVYFPDMGSMFTKAGATGQDPRIGRCQTAVAVQTRWSTRRPTRWWRRSARNVSAVRGVSSTTKPSDRWSSLVALCSVASRFSAVLDGRRAVLKC